MSKQVKTLLVWVSLIVLFFALWQFLRDNGGATSASADGEDGSSHSILTPVLTIVLPIVFVIVMFSLFMRRMGGGSLLSLRNTTARLVATSPNVRFEDVAGADAVKEQLLDVVDFLQHPKRWEKSGARLPRGILLEGPAGCGKTLLARAVASESKVPFFEVSASEFVEMFVGVGSARVRDLFEQAAKKAPAVIFIDELDAVGRRRGAASSSAMHQEREQTLNQILVSMDGFQSRARVVVFAATNRADVLDAALLRPGRFDFKLRIPPLSPQARKQALTIHTRNKALDAKLDLAEVAERTPGFTGAALEHLANEAAMQAVRRTRSNGKSAQIGLADFEAALERQKRDGAALDALDAVLVESTSQFAEPPGRVVVKLKLDSGEAVEGELVWADSCFIKLEQNAEQGSIVVPKAQVRSLEALQGTERIERTDLAPDRWARGAPEIG